MVRPAIQHRHSFPYARQAPIDLGVVHPEDAVISPPTFGIGDQEVERVPANPTIAQDVRPKPGGRGVAFPGRQKFVHQPAKGAGGRAPSGNLVTARLTPKKEPVGEADLIFGQHRWISSGRFKRIMGRIKAPELCRYLRKKANPTAAPIATNTAMIGQAGKTLGFDPRGAMV
jgi:hypothetical protein